MPVTGLVFNIARGSLHDGGGIRSVVYLKGCNLHCVWCQNPEGLSAKKQIVFIADKCICCGRCVTVCGDCHRIKDDRVVFLREHCTGCFQCAAVCPTNALTPCGEAMTPAEVFDEIVKDKNYYDASGGGVTFSGGECLLQPAFLKETLALCKQQGIHTAIETALHVPFKTVKDLAPLLDFVIVDFKHPDNRKHKEYTGVGNALIIENLTKLSLIHSNILVRIPLIPGINDDDETLTKAVKTIEEIGAGIKGIELLKYNNLYEQKYANVGEDQRFINGEVQSDETMQQLCMALNKILVKSGFVYFVS